MGMVMVMDLLGKKEFGSQEEGENWLSNKIKIRHIRMKPKNEIKQAFLSNANANIPVGGS